jgi:glycine/betaine/sarcosine/D-proline reductase family selenoprotein B
LGNPDKIRSAATRWGAYSIRDRADLDGGDYEISHGGYDAQFVRQDPDRLVPLDVMRELEREGAIGELHEEFLSTSGLANPLSNTRRMGREMGEGKTTGGRCDHPHLDVRNQHAQRRCDHHRIGEGRYPHGADYFRVARRQNGRRQSPRTR